MKNWIKRILQNVGDGVMSLLLTAMLVIVFAIGGTFISLSTLIGITDKDELFMPIRAIVSAT